MSPDFYNALLLFVSIFLTSTAIVSLLKRKTQKSNLYFGLFFLILGISIFFRFLESTHLIFKVPYLIEVDFPFCFLLSPFYIYFVKSYLYNYQPSKREQIIQSIPAILVFIFLLPVFLLNPIEKSAYLTNQASSSYSWRYQILNSLYFLQSVFYLIYTLIFIGKNKLNLSENSIYKVKILRGFTITLLSIQFITLLSIPLNQSIKKFNYTPILAIALLLLILVWLLQKSDLLDSSEKLTEEDISAKYKNSTLSIEDIAAHASYISQQINSRQLFLDKNISLSSLSSELNIPARTISEIINRHFCCSFNDLINGHRIEYSKVLLLKNISIMKIDSIGQNSGFNSRASFYTNFKKTTGLSPSEYIKNYHKDN